LYVCNNVYLVLTRMWKWFKISELLWWHIYIK